MTKPKKHYQFILFDWDGTLAKTLDIWLDASRTVLARRGIHPTDLEISGSFGTLMTDWPTLGVKDPRRAVDEAMELALTRLPNVELYPQVRETIEFLHQHGKQLALITSSFRVAIDDLLQEHGLVSFFDFIVSGEDLEHQKPDPESALIAMAGLNADKSRSILVGDSGKDLGCANNAGIDSVFFYPDKHGKFHSRQELRSKFHPTYTISEFHELKDLLVAP